MIDITLSKAKYRIPGKRVNARAWEAPTGDRAGVQFTGLYTTGNFKSKSANSGTKQKQMQGTGHRRRSYFCGCGPRHA